MSKSPAQLLFRQPEQGAVPLDPAAFPKGRRKLLVLRGSLMYDKIILPNGVRIVSEKMPHVRSSAIGIWLAVGSRYEKADESGAAHFIEHMLFKGTEKYTASELASIMDGIGGQINAFTSRENTCFYARVLDTHLDTAVEVLADMLFSSNLAPEDIQSERNVVLEEIDMYSDTPDDLAVERLVSKAFKGALGRPTLGKPGTLQKMTSESLRNFMNRHYTAANIVVSLAGSFTDAHLENISRLFSGLPAAKQSVFSKGAYTPVMTAKRKATEQNHICLAFPGMSALDENRYKLLLMSNILGGGMSSRLFQTVRETHGLCYSVYSFTSMFKDTGMLGIYTALNRETEEQAIKLILDEITKLLNDGVTEQELSRTREQVKSNVVMSMESSQSRMQKLGSGELVHGASPSPDELIRRYDAVTSEDILNTAREVLDLSKLSMSVVGKVKPIEQYTQNLELMGLGLSLADKKRI